MSLELYHLNPGLVPRVDPEPITYGPVVEAAVARVWAERQKAGGGHLFDGPVYGVGEIGPDRLVLRPGKFRHALARCVEPGLTATGLDIRQAAVSGLLLCPQGLVLGRRGGGVATDAGLWEPPPSGALDQPDLTVQIQEELEEELGLSPDTLSGVRLVGAVEEVATGLVDLVLLLTTDLSFASLERRWREHGSDEYTALRVVAVPELPALLAAEDQDCTPLLRAMLSLGGLA